jgi:MYXO-CTERM domain-containing protein
MFTVSSEGLAFSDSDSCGWSVARGAVAGATVLDDFPDPTNASRVLAVAATAGDAGINYAVLESSDGGATFGPTRYTAAAGDNITGVEIARSAPSTIYVAMTSGAAFAPKLARSMNGGTSWQVEDLSAKLPAKTSFIRLIAVDPQNADRVYLRVRSPAGEAFAVAAAGAGGASDFTVTTPLSFPDGILSAYARLASGTIVLAAVVGIDEVGYRSTDGGASFQPLPMPPSVRALSARGTTLYAVADNVVDGYAIGTSADEGQTWQPLMRYEQIAAIQACVKTACQVDCLARSSAGQWSEDFCAATPPASSDAGTAPPDAGDAGLPHDAGQATGGGGSGGGADASVSPPSNSGCACAVTAPAAPAGLPLMLAIAALARRRRRQRSTHDSTVSQTGARENRAGQHDRAARSCL